MDEQRTEDFIDVVVERTFLHYPIPKDISKAPDFPESAPCCGREGHKLIILASFKRGP